MCSCGKWRQCGRGQTGDQSPKAHTVASVAKREVFIKGQNKRNSHSRERRARACSNIWGMCREWRLRRERGKERGRKEGQTQKINNDFKAAWVLRTVQNSWAEFPLVPRAGCGREVGSHLDF